MKMHYSCLLLILSFQMLILVTAITGQHTVKNATLIASDTLFSSPGYVDSLEYAVNMSRDFRFQTYYPNHTLILTVIEFVLEQEDKNGDCLYDKVTLYDGYDSSAPVLAVLCGTIPAGTTYQTSGDTVYVVFYSDYANIFKGFQMSVKSDGPTTTTSTTTTSTMSTTNTAATTHSPTKAEHSQTTSITVSTPSPTSVPSTSPIISTMATVLKATTAPISQALMDISQQQKKPGTFLLLLLKLNE